MLRTVLTLALIFVGSQQSYAETMRLVTGNGFAPYSDISLPGGGLVTEIVASVYQEMGFETDIQFGDWDRGYADTVAGRFEATFPYQPDQIKSDEFFMSAALMVVRQLIFVPRMGQSRFWTLRDLSEKSYCVPRSYRLNSAMTEHMATNTETIVMAPEMRDCFLQLMGGSVDYVPAYDLAGLYYAMVTTGSADQIEPLGEPLGLGTLHLLIPKSQPNAVAHQQNFNRVFRQMESDGAIEILTRRYINALQPRSENRDLE